MPYLSTLENSKNLNLNKCIINKAILTIGLSIMLDESPCIHTYYIYITTVEILYARPKTIQRYTVSSRTLFLPMLATRIIIDHPYLRIFRRTHILSPFCSPYIVALPSCPRVHKNIGIFLTRFPPHRFISGRDDTGEGAEINRILCIPYNIICIYLYTRVYRATTIRVHE